MIKLGNIPRFSSVSVVLLQLLREQGLQQHSDNGSLTWLPNGDLVATERAARELQQSPVGRRFLAAAATAEAA
jgi:hypothetical protein